MKTILQRISFALAALLLLTATLEAGQTPKNFSGIQGRMSVYISYGLPYEVEPGIWIGVPSIQMPVAVSFSVFSVKTRKEVACGTSDANGNFAVSLPAGKYLLVPHDLNLALGHSIATSPVEVTVVRQRVTPISVCYFQNGPLTVFNAPAR